MKKASSLFASILLLAAFCPAAISQSRAQGLRTVIVRQLEGTDPAAAATVSGIIKVGLASTGFFQVLDNDEQSAAEPPDAAPAPAVTTGPSFSADYIVEGSVKDEGDALSVSYRLIACASGYVMLAKTAAIQKATVEQDAASLAAELGNAMLASFAGSTAQNIHALIDLGRYDEAAERLNALRDSEPANPELQTLTDGILIGRARYWLASARNEAAAAQKQKGLDALEAAYDAENSLESAYLFAPPGSAGDSLRMELKSVSERELAPALKRAKAEALGSIKTAARSALRAGDPERALGLIDDFTAANEGFASDTGLIALRGKAAGTRASQLADRARHAADSNNYELSRSLIAEALSIAPDSPAALKASDEIGKREAGLAARARADQGILESGRANTEISWALCAGLGFAGFECGDFDLPLTGLFPGLDASFGSYFKTHTGIGGAWRASIFAGSGSHRISICGYSGSLDAFLGLVEGGVELDLLGKAVRPGSDQPLAQSADGGAERSDSLAAAAGRLSLGPSVDLGFAVADSSASYSSISGASGQKLSFAPTMRLGAFLEYSLSSRISARFYAGIAEAWFIGFGPVSGARVSLLLRYTGH